MIQQAADFVAQAQKLADKTVQKISAARYSTARRPRYSRKNSHNA
jgi:hypothetical protein